MTIEHTFKLRIYDVKIRCTQSLPDIQNDCSPDWLQQRYAATRVITHTIKLSIINLPDFKPSIHLS